MSDIPSAKTVILTFRPSLADAARILIAFALRRPVCLEFRVTNGIVKKSMGV